MSDPSNGYEAIAAEFLAGRGNSKTREIAVGVRTVQAWAKTVRPGVGREFDGVIAWGLLFLLQPAVQAQLIGQVAHALVRGGRFVFTAPRDACVWNDAMTGRRSESLTPLAYRRLLGGAGLMVIDETEDEGENHYYMSLKR